MQHTEVRVQRIHPGVVVAAVLGVALLASATGATPPLAFPVSVGGTVRQVPKGTTFGFAVAALGLEPRAGSLVDVEGEVLEEGRYPGAILLNGRRADPTTPLEAGDRIRMVAGRDHREDVVREVTTIAEGRPGNPQFFLATTPGDQIVTRGKISRKIVSTVFVPSGDQQTTPAVALTFDDGPSPTWTPRILEVLDEYDVPATFFVVGYLAERFPELVRKEVAAGHQVASHSYGHPLSPQFELLPKDRVTTEIRHARNVLRHLGVPAGLFRPPFGSYDDQVLRIAKKHGQRLVLWNVDPGDWRSGATVRQVMANVRAHVRAGSIILLHDGGGDRSVTLAVLPRIIRYVRSLGLDLVAIGAVEP